VIKPTLQVAEEPVTEVMHSIADNRISQRVASIDWMRGLVMILMIVRSRCRGGRYRVFGGRQFCVG
jgi:uncharacterized membrane protein